MQPVAQVAFSMAMGQVRLSAVAQSAALNNSLILRD
jgi:hypothetical protein